MTPFACVASALPQLLSSIESSTQNPATKRDWSLFMELHVGAYIGRADQAERARQARTSRIRSAIFQADAALPASLSRQQRCQLIHKRLRLNPAFYGLPRGPSERTVRKVINEVLDQERQKPRATMPTPPTTPEPHNGQAAGSPVRIDLDRPRA